MGVVHEKVAASLHEHPPISSLVASMPVKRIMTCFKIAVLLFPIFGIVACRKPDALLPAAMLPDREISEPYPADSLSDYVCVNPYKMPVFPGGESALLRFIIQHMRYTAVCSEVIGLTVISFIVEPDGTTGDLKILKRPHPCIEPSVREMFAQMPRWTPGEFEGKPVRIRMTFPIRLCLR